MIIWVITQPGCGPEVLGYIATFLDDTDPRPAKEQFDTNYKHGGGWRKFDGFTMLPNGDMQYPGDPPTICLAVTKLRDETIRFYRHSWVAIIQPDGTYEVARMD